MQTKFIGNSDAFRLDLKAEAAMADLSKQTKTERMHYHYMADAMRRFEWDLHNTIEGTSRIPPEWHDIAKSRTAKRKIRMTMLVEEDVVRFFKSMGAGHGARINEVLRSFMHARLAGVIKGADTISYFKRREGLHDGERPLWGDTAREFEDAPPATEAEKLFERVALLREEIRRRQAEE